MIKISSTLPRLQKVARGLLTNITSLADAPHLENMELFYIQLFPNTKTKKHHTRIIINRTPPHDPGVCERPRRKDGSPYAGVIQAALRIGIVKKYLWLFKYFTW